MYRGFAQHTMSGFYTTSPSSLAPTQCSRHNFLVVGTGHGSHGVRCEADGHPIDQCMTNAM